MKDNVAPDCQIRGNIIIYLNDISSNHFLQLSPESSWLFHLAAILAGLH